MILCLSPIGEAFRERTRMFPGLVNCTTIDWFIPWPSDALFEVAAKLLEAENLGTADARQSIYQVRRTYSCLVYSSIFLVFFFWGADAAATLHSAYQEALCMPVSVLLGQCVDANAYVCTVMRALTAQQYVHVTDWPIELNASHTLHLLIAACSGVKALSHQSFDARISSCSAIRTQVTILKGSQLHPTDSKVQTVLQVFVTAHESVSVMSNRMLQSLKRHNYVTPTNYLEFVNGYRILLKEKRSTLTGKSSKLRGGLTKLDETAIQVGFH